eukprot:TRINITY_DN65896_c2_g1_i1.p1 TRINITY_DN65896_c2_g1~~TRINITY_DN65896_c2_g1_i1.p1  ORF type:complete len:609 (-),score=340.88 TRINITY_DN65896_c2_g1_i1:119-1945(-)
MSWFQHKRPGKLQSHPSPKYGLFSPTVSPRRFGTENFSLAALERELEFKSQTPSPSSSRSASPFLGGKDDGDAGGAAASSASSADDARAQSPSSFTSSSSSSSSSVSNEAAQAAAVSSKAVVMPPRTKIICTIGPASAKPDVLKNLLNAGMNVVRLNFSHGSHSYAKEIIRMVREVGTDTRRICAILLDTKGPEIRTGLLEGGSDVQLEKGQKFTFKCLNTSDGDEEVLNANKGNSEWVGVQYPNMYKVLEVGNVVLVDDGLLSMTVTEITEGEVHCVVDNAGALGEKKGINLPGVVVDLPSVTPKDIRDLQFGVEQNVDFIAASFVRKREDIVSIRKVLGPRGQHIRIIAKIENQEGLDNFDSILAEADGIMVARGDLGVEIPLEQVSLAQKMMIRKCNAAGKFVITATQMLESMVKNPSPTRAEASDVANAVFDGTDCVMLSGESAKGKYPVEAVKVMGDICREVEAYTNFASHYNAIRQSASNMSIAEAVAASAVKASIDLKAGALLVFSESGQTARLVAKYRPKAPVLTITNSEVVARQSMAIKSLFPLLVGSMLGTDSLVERVLMAARGQGMLEYGATVVIVSGTIEGQAGSTNMIKIDRVRF